MPNFRPSSEPGENYSAFGTGYRRSILLAAVLVVGLTALLAGMAGSAIAQTTTAPDCTTMEYNGSGTADDPYEVENVSQLQCIETQDSGAHYGLVSDIDASGTVQWNGGAGFKPINDTTSEFTGTLNGNGYVIDGLFIDRPTQGFVGLVSVNEGVIKNVTLTDVDITGDSKVGAIVGRSDNAGTDPNVGNPGTIVNSSASGTVSGSSRRVGGLVGETVGTTIQNVSANVTVNANGATSSVGGLVGDSSAYIKNAYANGDVNAKGVERVGGLLGSSTNYDVEQAYATGNVTGDNKVGGLVGQYFDTTNGNVITQTYAVGTVTGNTSVGGLVGSKTGVTVESDTYWNTETTGQDTSAGGSAGLTTAEMKGTAATTNMSGLDFSGTWDIRSGLQPSYPFLQSIPQSPAPGLEPLYAGGTGTEAEPYGIANWEQLNNTRYNLSSNFTLVEDLDNTTTGYDTVANESANGGNGFVPIGSDLGGTISGTPFSGTFNGSGHTISDVAIDRGSEQEVGVFGEVNGTVRNVSVQNGTVTGGRDVGALIGFVDGQGTLANVSANATVTANGVSGTARVGVLVGNSFGTIRNVTASGVVDATTANRAGVLVGNNGGNIVDSTADGNATGASYIGGVAGSSSDLIENTSATGNVSGGSYLGGVAGANQGFVYASNASTTVSSADQNSFALAGLVGQNSGDIFFSNTSVTITGGVLDTGGLVGSNTAGATIRGSYAVGDIVANDSATGGLVGTQSGRVVNSYANVTVDGASGSFNKTGGLVGSNDGTIRRSYAVGNVSGGGLTAGIAGENLDTINASYWDTDATNQSSAVDYNSGTVTNTAGLTTSEMTGESATNKMPGFDFDSTWTTVAGEYPPLAYQTGNGPPVARTEEYTVQENEMFTLSAPGVLSNDLDPDRDTLTTTVTGQPSHGDLTLQSDGSLTYTPDSEFTGVDQFTYEASDGSLTDMATVTLYVSDQVAVDVTDLAGSGTRSNPYVVTNVSELQAMEDDLTANYTLGSDIDATGTVAWNKGKGFDPVVELGGFGNPNPPFSGDFDGSGHTIRGLTIDRPNTDFVGLFGKAIGGDIENATITDANITGQAKVGVLAGEAEEDDNSVNAQFRNVEASGTVTGTSSSVGGLIGKAQRASMSGRAYLIENTTVNVSVTSSGTKVGGLVGESREPLVVRDTRVTGNVTGQSSDVGGLVGQHEGTLENVTATGTVTGTNDVGGLIGTVDDTAPISNVSATGNVSGDSDVGGLIGDFTSSGTPITDAYATGEVNASGDNVGGFAGENEGVLNRTYATGNVSGNDFVGGLVGTTSTGVINRSYAVGGLSVDVGEAAIGGLVGQNSGTPINDSYYDTEMTGIDRAVGFGRSRTTNVAGVTTAQLTGDAAPSNATRFDFTRSWATVESASGASYPYLRNNSQLPAPNITSTVAATDSYTVTEDETLAVSAPGVLDNDDRLGGTTLTVTGVAAAPTSGTVSLAANGSFTYTPTAGFTGTDTFDYTVRDASGDTAIVGVTITVEASGGSDDDDGGNGGGGGGGGGATEPEGPLSDVVSQLAETEPATETSVQIEDSDPETPGVTVEPPETQSVKQIGFDEEVDGSVDIKEYTTPSEAVSQSISDTLAGDGGNAGQATTSNVVSVYDISRRTATGEEPDQSVSATLTFSVDRSALAAPGDAVVLHETDSGWEQLDTTVTDVTSDEVTLTAQTDSFSVFAVAEIGSGDADSAPQTESPSDTDDGDADTGTDAPDTGGTGSSVLLVAGVVVLVAAAAAVLWIRRTE